MRVEIRKLEPHRAHCRLEELEQSFLVDGLGHMSRSLHT
jgi:hypothetical protein